MGFVFEDGPFDEAGVEGGEGSWEGGEWGEGWGGDGGGGEGSDLDVQGEEVDAREGCAVEERAGENFKEGLRTEGKRDIGRTKAWLRCCSVSDR